jgi:2-polyprenyl-3-methyl-5-hydroxy-6-metoxy-1,4-benzoquinol methylase
MTEAREDRRARWNERHAAGGNIEGHEANPYVVAVTAGMEPGRALDLASGAGATAVWLATRGWRVTAVDFSSVGLRRGRERADAAGVSVEWIEADVLDYEPDPAAFDLVTILFLQVPAVQRGEVYRRAATAVAPGGTLLVVGHDRTNLAEGVGGPPDPEVLFAADEVEAAVDGFRVLQSAAVRRPVEDGRFAIDAVFHAERIDSPARRSRP